MPGPCLCSGTRTRVRRNSQRKQKRSYVGMHMRCLTLSVILQPEALRGEHDLQWFYTQMTTEVNRIQQLAAKQLAGNTFVLCIIASNMIRGAFDCLRTGRIISRPIVVLLMHMNNFSTPVGAGGSSSP